LIFSYKDRLLAETLGGGLLFSPEKRKKQFWREKHHKNADVLINCKRKINKKINVNKSLQ